jgi:hypothetical protein
MNASFNRHKATTRDKIFINGIEIGFCLPKHYPIDNTFHHNNGVSESQIDYFLTFNNSDILQNIRVVQRESLNTPTHDLVMAELSLVLGNVPTTVENHSEVPTKMNWSKCGIQTFQQLVNEQIMREDLFHLCYNETKLEKLVDILNVCAKEAARSKPKPVKQSKPWYHEIRNLCKISKQYHWEWKNSGTPKSKDNLLWLRCIHGVYP